MYTGLTSTHWFGARTVVSLAVVLAICIQLAQAQDGCRVECYPNTKVINGKGGVGKSDNCRWILRTDGKPARLCDHIKCKKVCPSNQGASSLISMQQSDQQEAASGDNMRIEQQLEGDSQQQQQQPQGIMRQLHGSKLAKAPVPGVAGGKLSNLISQQQPAASSSSNGRRMAPTLPPTVQYEENDTPPPIGRFLDISPEE